MKMVRKNVDKQPSFRELFIGLVGPIGTDLGSACELLERALRGMKLQGPPLKTMRINVIESLHKVERFSRCREKPEDVRIKHHMDLGDRFRKRMDRGDALAINALYAIQTEHREQKSAGAKKSRNVGNDNLGSMPSENTVFLFKSLKHPDEVKRLRETYKEAFFLVSCYMSERERRRTLRDRISDSHPSPPHDLEDKVTKLLKRDYEDKLTPLGQKASECFHMADVFVDISDEQIAKAQIERFVKILFSHPYITPNPDEFAMFHARASAYRSADLARQVGAVICNPDGEIVATGMNEVPMAGGGTYTGESGRDFRDFQQGHDSSTKWKRKILFEIVTAMKKEGWLSAEKKKTPDERALTELEKIFKKHDCRVVRLIEFLRPAHAEMAALMDAARRGVSVKGCTMYCTVFPCHECARLIIASGIMRVVYIEPYPKSAVADLYFDSVLIEPTADEILAMPKNNPKVLFQPFVGISPRFYNRAFDSQGLQRKDKKGRAIDWDSRPCTLRFNEKASVYIENEKMALEILAKKMEEAGLKYQ